MMQIFKLSICIPTFNRHGYLAETLESIYSQLSDELMNIVEVVVSDNASIDNTVELIREYRQKFDNITFFRWPENMGADRNYLKVIEQAHGEYCWFFGSDDILMEGGIRKVLAEINNEHSEIILFDRSVSDEALIADPVETSWSNIPSRFFFHTKMERHKFIQYIDKCTSLGGVFSFLSVIIFKKKRWDAIPLKDRFVGSAYVHVHVLFSIMAEGSYFTYVKESLVLCRMGNDSFCPDQSWESIYKRVKLDIDGYHEIVPFVFGSDTIISRKFFLLLERILPIPSLVGIRTYLPQEHGTAHRLDTLLLNCGYYRSFIVVSLLVSVKKTVRVFRRIFKLS